MDRDQHVTQDAAELYAVYVMQRTAQDLGLAIGEHADRHYDEFLEYLDRVGLSVGDFSDGAYSQYKVNADSQLPDFVERLAHHHSGAKFHFENVEKEYRDKGLKGDFSLKATTLETALSVSLKNYIGTGGIGRPQVGSGTYASFAQGFIFERVGVGTFLDPLSGETFRGANVDQRNAVLDHLGLSNLIHPLSELDACQAQVREEFLSPECEFYDQSRVELAARRVAERGIEATLTVFETLGLDRVKTIVLTRAGLDGKEEALYFDATRHVDSITNSRYHNLRLNLNDEDTSLKATQQGQGIRFEFQKGESLLLSIHVPYTINTNGAWFRPRERFEGTKMYNDKGHLVELSWGQRRPYKSREIATSTNMYVDLIATGIFSG